MEDAETKNTEEIKFKNMYNNTLQASTGETVVVRKDVSESENERYLN